MSGHDELFDSLLADFLDESSQLIVTLNESLLELDELLEAATDDQPMKCDEELMNRMFRAAHSIKGLSAMLGLPHINGLTHKIENVFDAARKEQLSLDTGSVDVIFRSVDRLGEMIETLKNDGHDNVDATDLASAIQSLLECNGCVKNVEMVTSVDQVAAPQPTPAASNDVAINNPARPMTGETDLFANIEDDGEVPPQYLAIFIDDSVETLDSINDTLLKVDSLEPAAANEALLVTSHRLKGSAASVGLHRAAKLAHLMEDVFQELRERGLPMNTPLVDSMFACCDALRGFVESLRDSKGSTSTFNQLAHDLVAAKAIWDSENPRDGANESEEASTPTPQATPAATSAGSGRSYLATVTVNFEKNLAAAGLKASLICEKISGLGQIEISDPDVSKLADLDNLTEWMFAIRTTAAEAKLKDKCDVTGVTRVDIALPPGIGPEGTEAPAQAAPAPVTPAAPTPKATAPSATPPAATTQVPAAAPASPPAPAQAAKPASAAQAAASSAEAPSPAAKPAAPANAPGEAKGGKSGPDTSKPAETLRVDIERLDQLMNLAGQLVINKARFTQIGEQMKSTMVSKQTPQVMSDAINLTRQLTKSLDSADAFDSARLPQLQMHLQRLSLDLDMLEREFGRVTQQRSNVNHLFEAIHQLDRVADGIQQGVMDTRMVPVGPLFARFKRIVRDITRSTGKQIELEIIGEKTELDKRMIDALGDPLIHMVRNSADHGIETPELRREAGKPESGTITLNAFHRGNHIYIEVKDDGRGLNREKIVAKALERNLVTEADLEKMTDHQIYQLIWEPGFSTAEKITEISGRGMGMDIVQAKIEEISGSVEVNCQPGQGTIFTIKLPLTMAILPSLMAVIGDGIFALPVESVVEIVSIPGSSVRTIQGQRTASIRNRVVSLVELQDVFHWHGESNDELASDEVTLVIVGQEGHEVGLRVDSLIGEEDVVIKSLAENYRNVAGLAGAAILGSGQVSLIIDIPVLIEMASRRWQRQTV
ncbi:MAG: Hpt domain-containing protein [Pirellulaceae bacterium]